MVLLSFDTKQLYSFNWNSILFIAMPAVFVIDTCILHPTRYMDVHEAG